MHYYFFLFLQREEQMQRETERLGRERRKEEERLMRERQREEEKFQREQKCEHKHMNKFMYKQSIWERVAIVVDKKINNTMFLFYGTIVVYHVSINR